MVNHGAVEGGKGATDLQGSGRMVSVEQRAQTFDHHVAANWDGNHIEAPVPHRLRYDVPDNRIDILLDGGGTSSLWWATKNEWLGSLTLPVPASRRSTATLTAGLSLRTAGSTSSWSVAERQPGGSPRDMPLNGDLKRQEETMILEHAVLNVAPGKQEQFEEAFNQAKATIASMPGFLSLRLTRCMEHTGRYLLLLNGNGSRTTPKASAARPNTSSGGETRSVAKEWKECSATASAGRGVSRSSV